MGEAEEKLTASIIHCQGPLLRIPRGGIDRVGQRGTLEEEGNEELKRKGYAESSSNQLRAQGTPESDVAECIVVLKFLRCCPELSHWQTQWTPQLYAERVAAGYLRLAVKGKGEGIKGNIGSQNRSRWHTPLPGKVA